MGLNVCYSFADFPMKLKRPITWSRWCTVNIKMDVLRAANFWVQCWERWVNQQLHRWLGYFKASALLESKYDTKLSSCHLEVGTVALKAIEIQEYSSLMPPINTVKYFIKPWSTIYVFAKHVSDFLFYLLHFTPFLLSKAHFPISQVLIWKKKGTQTSV